jgi:hypothetical protein
MFMLRRDFVKYSQYWKVFRLRVLRLKVSILSWNSLQYRERDCRKSTKLCLNRGTLVTIDTAN